MKNRSRVDIVAAILENAADGITRTRLMYKTFTSFAQVKSYLLALEEAGLVTHDTKNEIYTTTEKGRQLVAAYNSMHNMLQVKPKDD